MRRLVALLVTILISNTAQATLPLKNVLFSHQSVGRNMIANPVVEGASGSIQGNYAASHIRTLLNNQIIFWDHDYYGATALNAQLVPLRRSGYTVRSNGVKGWKYNPAASDSLNQGFPIRTNSAGSAGWGTPYSSSYPFLPGLLSFAQIATHPLRGVPIAPTALSGISRSDYLTKATNWRNFLEHTYTANGQTEGEPWDLVILKPGYRQMHIPTDDNELGDMFDGSGNFIMSLEDLKTALNDVSDWWHSNPETSGRLLAICSSSSLRKPYDGASNSDLTAGWAGITSGTPTTDTAGIGRIAPYLTLYPGTNGWEENRQIATVETIRQRAFNDWLKKVWINRHPENKAFLFWEASIGGSSAGADSLYTNPLYRGGTSGDHHLNNVGSTALQGKFITWLHETVYPEHVYGSEGYPQGTTLPTPVITRVWIDTWNSPGGLSQEGARINIAGTGFGTTLQRSGYPEGKVVVGTNSTYAASVGTATAQLHVGQEIETWSDTLITIKTRFGSTAETCLYTTLEGKYMYVLNRIGNPSVGFRLITKTVTRPRILSLDRGVF